VKRIQPRGMELARPRQLGPVVHLALAASVLSVAPAADAKDIARAYRTDASKVYVLEMDDFKRMQTNWQSQNRPASDITDFANKINRNSDVFQPGGGTINSTRFPSRAVFAVILICRQIEDRYIYYREPLEYDNRASVNSDYSSRNFMCTSRS
jgi:hypothetical protein